MVSLHLAQEPSLEIQTGCPAPRVKYLNVRTVLLGLYLYAEQLSSVQPRTELASGRQVGIKAPYPL